MIKHKVTCFAPATIANISAGFDVLGVALQHVGDIAVAKKIKNSHEFHFNVKTNYENIPSTIKNNIAAFVAKKMMDELQLDFGIDLTLHKNLGIGTGLGSSAASCVATATAINGLLKKPLSKHELLPFILAGEKKASGASHADNVAPCLFGGACIIRNENPIDIIPFPIHRSLYWVVIHPHIIVTTKSARSILPKHIELPTVTRQLGNISGFILGLMSGNHRLIQTCSVDYIAEPYRTKLIPNFHEMKISALKKGALAFGISGSGPSVFAITHSLGIAENIVKNVTKILKNSADIKATYYISKTNTKGATLIPGKSL